MLKEGKNIIKEDYHKTSVTSWFNFTVIYRGYKAHVTQYDVDWSFELGYPKTKIFYIPKETCSINGVTPLNEVNYLINSGRSYIAEDKLEYNIDQIIGENIELERLYIKFLLDGERKANDYWMECRKTETPYCYGRNDIDLNYYYAECNERQVYNYTIIPKEVWNIPNKAFAKLIKY